jgi:hypothetical protein
VLLTLAKGNHLKKGVNMKITMYFLLTLLSLSCFVYSQETETREITAHPDDVQIFSNVVRVLKLKIIDHTDQERRVQYFDLYDSRLKANTRNGLESLKTFITQSINAAKFQKKFLTFKFTSTGRYLGHTKFSNRQSLYDNAIDYMTLKELENTNDSLKKKIEKLQSSLQQARDSKNEFTLQMDSLRISKQTEIQTLKDQIIRTQASLELAKSHNKNFSKVINDFYNIIKSESFETRKNPKAIGRAILENADKIESLYESFKTAH